jgi:hypothetical protein
LLLCVRVLQVVSKPLPLDERMIALAAAISGGAMVRLDVHVVAA